MNQSPVFAIEGPCCAGKTTLALGLVEELQPLSILYICDYANYVGGGKFLPPPVPSSLADEEQILSLLLDIEADRTSPLRRPAHDMDLVIIDRSVHTLLAHCFALGKLLPDDYFGLAQRVIGKSNIPCWPDFIVYLDAPQYTIESRNDGKFAPDSIFIDVGFNNGVRSYFQHAASLPSPRVVWLDATLDAIMVRARAAAQLRQWLEQLGVQVRGVK